MDSPGGYEDSPAEDNDMVYPCKGCGEILEEGKAFELAGNRWHIDCFRCNTCGTLLDSDANLLLLGDGSLICNNCTYSCSACGNKIEDLAILTGDQAFCASCFRCRNCKCQIENLRYARTSQGIFCMACHESLMRRRKKSRAAKAAANGGNNSAGLDKSLPALPPPAPKAVDRFASAFDADSESYSSSRDISPNTATRSKRDATESLHDLSPTRGESLKENNSPTHDAKINRNSFVVGVDDPSRNNELGIFSPNTFEALRATDENTLSLKNPMSPSNRSVQESNGDGTGRGPREYPTRARQVRSPSRQDLMNDSSLDSSRSTSTEREQSGIKSPHIAYQEKGRAPPSDRPDTRPKRKKNKPSGPGSPSFTLQRATNAEPFKLQEAPRPKRAGSRSGSQDDVKLDSKSPASSATASQAGVTPRIHHTESERTGGPFAQLEEYQPASDLAALSISSPANIPPQVDVPARGDSLSNMRSSGRKLTKGTKGKGARDGTTSPPDYGRDFDRRASGASLPLSEPAGVSSSPRFTTGDAIPRQFEISVPKNTYSNQGSYVGTGISKNSASSPATTSDNYYSPRIRPQPSLTGKPMTSSVDAIYSDHAESSPMRIKTQGIRSDAGGENEMAAFLEGADGPVSGSMLRNASNAVKHGRSFSDKVSRANSQGIRSPQSVHTDLTSPDGPLSPERDDVPRLKRQIRRFQQRNTELETELYGFKERVGGIDELSQMKTELQVKRQMVASLESERELTMRELDVFTERLLKVNESKKPLDAKKFTSETINDIQKSIQRWKDHVRPEIESLILQRNELVDQVANLIRLKDTSVQELETARASTVQLRDEISRAREHNQQLQDHTLRVGNDGRGAFPAHARSQMSSATHSPMSPTNGLGIQTQQQKDRSDFSIDPRIKPESLVESRFKSDVSSEVLGTPSVLSGTTVTSMGGTTLNLSDSQYPPSFGAEGADGVDSTTIAPATQVVSIKKGGKPKAFSGWGKGSRAMAKNVKLGLKGAFIGSERYPMLARDGPSMLEGTPYNSMPIYERSESSQSAMSNISGPTSTVRQNELSRPQPAFGGFGVPISYGQKNGSKGHGSGKHSGVSSLNASVPDASTSLFGSDLSARCEFERRIIPSIVSGCIEEVELRGMNVEGIYRKSGGASQVKILQAGFEKDANYNISDPDLDIHSVTSALKQYFRKLPMPLITFEVYDLLIDAQAIQDEQQRLAKIRDAFNELPKYHKDVLEFLIFHLVRIMQHAKTNFMSSANLAVVFAPTIMRPISLEREMADMQLQRNTIQQILENQGTIFPDSRTSPVQTPAASSDDTAAVPPSSTIFKKAVGSGNARYSPSPNRGQQVQQHAQQQPQQQTGFHAPQPQPQHHPTFVSAGPYASTPPNGAAVKQHTHPLPGPSVLPAMPTRQPRSDTLPIPHRTPPPAPIEDVLYPERV